MDEMQAIQGIAESLTLVSFLLGFMIIALRYVDGLRRDEQTTKNQRTEDIIKDWRKLRDID